MRVGYIHDWKSTWFSEKEFADYLLEDIQIREHIDNKLSHAGLSEHHDQEEQGRGGGQHPHGPARHRDRQVRQRGGRPAQGAPQDDQQGREGEHPRDQAARAGRQAGGAVDRRAAGEPRGLPPRDEALADLGHALGRQGRAGPGLGPPGRRRDGAHRGLLRRPRAPAHDPRRHRLRLLRGQDHLRPHRREGVDQQGRDHAQGLRAGPHRARGAPAGARRRPRAAAARRRSRWRRSAAAAAAAWRAGVGADASAQARQAPQAAPRPQGRLRQGRHRRSSSASTASRPSIAAGSPTARSRPPESP